jgi:CO/xanthine dehydrogenase Mo-binding subunit
MPWQFMTLQVNKILWRLDMTSIKHARFQSANVSRRNFLIGSVGASVMMAFAPSALAATATAQQSLADKVFSPTVWFEIDATGKVLINIAKAEMGQHVGTALARIIADELGADWEQVHIRHVDTDPKWGYMVTGGSWSIFTSYQPLSQAGAAGRVALIEAGAELAGVEASDCDTEGGCVVTPKGRLQFSEIVQKGRFNRNFSQEDMAKLPLKSKSAHKLIGKNFKALDIPAKTNGGAKYGIDVEIDGMIYARPILPPTRYGSKVLSVNDSGAKSLTGYLGFEILEDPSATLQGWVSVLARDYPTAIKAADIISVKYQAGPRTHVDEQQILSEGERQVKETSEGVLFVDEGNVDRAKQDANNHLSAIYRTNTALHFALEPMNTTAELKQGIWHIHAGNQWQSLTLPVLAKALQVDEDRIVMHQYYLGGGFGRRLYGDYMIPAALTAKQTGKPVKLIFTRADDSRFDQPRSPSVSRFEASLDNNALTGVSTAHSSGWPTLDMAPGFMPESLDKKGKFDPFSASGADHWYTMPNHRARVINNTLAQETFLPGWLRSVGQGWIVWGLESFIDEIAHNTERDPVEFRLSMLDGKGKQAGKAPESVGGALRLKNTLEVLKQRIGYGNKLPMDEGIGVAVTAGQERTMPAWIATAAHVHVNRQTGKITVKKITMVVDAGLIVHPDGALAQLEGSAFWGVSLALNEFTEFEKGQVKDVNLNSYLPLRMNEIPELDIHFVESEEVPTGLGEPGVIGIGPAIGNAVYQAVGVRLRDLPMKAQHVLDGLAAEVTS